MFLHFKIQRQPANESRWNCSISIQPKLYRVSLSLEAPKYVYKNMLLRQWLENLYTHSGNDAKQDLLLIDAETGLFHIQAHLNAFLQILEHFFQSVDVDGLNLLAYNVWGL